LQLEHLQQHAVNAVVLAVKAVGLAVNAVVLAVKAVGLAVNAVVLAVKALLLAPPTRRPMAARARRAIPGVGRQACGQPAHVRK
jgi:hypothetical protein